MNEPAKKDPAATRFAIISLSRLVGALAVIAGLPMYSGKLPPSPILGVVLIMAGLAAFFYLPRVLSNRWRSPPE